MMNRKTTRNYAYLLLAIPGVALVLCMVVGAMSALAQVGTILKDVLP